MNLTELLTLWIGEGAKGIDPVETKNDDDVMYNRLNENLVNGYNIAIQDLKSKIPDLIDQIELYYAETIKTDTQWDGNGGKPLGKI